MSDQELFWTMKLIKKLLFFCFHFVISLDENEFVEKPIEREAKFTTVPQNSMVNEGGTIRLPCFVDRIEGYVLLWKFGETILSVGGRVIDSSERQARLQLEEEINGNNLVIHSAKSEDSGQYLCQISDFVPRDISHHVIVRTRPQVRVAAKRVVATAGDTLSLTCEAVAGHPAPELSWSRQAGPGDQLQLVSFGGQLQLHNVTRAEAGSWVCRGDNGHSGDHRAVVSVRVSHAPHIAAAGASWVHSSHGLATLRCPVSSHPAAQVTWYNGTDTELAEPLSGAEFNMTREDGDTVSTAVWTLEVDTEPSEDTQYTCVAANSLGEARMVVTVTQRPDAAADLRYSEAGFQWSVHSGPPVTEFQVQVERGGVTRQLTVAAAGAEGEAGVWRGSWAPDPPLSPGSEARVRVAGVNTHGRGPRSEWLSVTEPAVSGSWLAAPVLAWILVAVMCDTHL